MIKLNGHHIEVLSKIISGNKKLEDLVKGLRETPQNNILVEERLNKEGLRYIWNCLYNFKIGDFFDYIWDGIKYENFYDEETIIEVTDFFKNLINNPDIEFEVSKGVDSICKICCNKERIDCKEYSNHNSLRLNLGERKKVKDILMYT